MRGTAYEGCIVDVIWYTAMSMDGRIADAHGSLDFLSTFDDGAEQDFDQFIAHIDAVVIGANTMRWLLDHGHGWPHSDLETWLVTHDETLVDHVRSLQLEAVDQPSGQSNDQSNDQTSGQPQPVHWAQGPLGPMFEQIAARGHRRVWLCGGGDVAAQALRQDYIDEVVVTIAPTVVGAGPTLFDGDDLPARRFALQACRPWAGGGARMVWRRIP